MTLARNLLASSKNDYKLLDDKSDSIAHEAQQNVQEQKQAVVQIRQSSLEADKAELDRLNKAIKILQKPIRRKNIIRYGVWLSLTVFLIGNLINCFGRRSEFEQARDAYLRTPLEMTNSTCEYANSLTPWYTPTFWNPESCRFNPLIDSDHYPELNKYVACRAALKALCSVIESITLNMQGASGVLVVDVFIALYLVSDIANYFTPQCAVLPNWLRNCLSGFNTREKEFIAEMKRDYNAPHAQTWEKSVIIFTAHKQALEEKISQNNYPEAQAETKENLPFPPGVTKLILEYAGISEKPTKEQCVIIRQTFFMAKVGARNPNKRWDNEEESSLGNFLLSFNSKKPKEVASRDALCQNIFELADVATPSPTVFSRSL